VPEEYDSVSVRNFGDGWIQFQYQHKPHAFEKIEGYLYVWYLLVSSRNALVLFYVYQKYVGNA
jgi:hypothetical protein